jgi:hypothetical protein
MEKGNSTSPKKEISWISAILEEAKRKNLMDWGEIEIAESVIRDTQKS